MNAEQYRSLSQHFSETRARSNTVKALHDVLPLVMYIFYPTQLICLGVNEGWGSERFLRFMLVPLCTLILVTVLRIIINAPRPYEKYNYTPAVHKDTKGRSFPSRHTVSAFIIAMAFMYIQVSLGILMMVLAAVIAVVRVISGVHFVRDVIGGAAIGLVIGALGFFVF